MLQYGKEDRDGKNEELDVHLLYEAECISDCGVGAADHWFAALCGLGNVREDEHYAFR